MKPEYSIEDLPSEVVQVNGKEWQREKFDKDSYQWVRPLEDTEYNWDVEEDDISLVGTDVPIRVVSIQYNNNWVVEGAETAGPKYHRPGFTELISSEYVDTFDNSEEAFEAIRIFIKKLS